jgi:hypothetical protein
VLLSGAQRLKFRLLAEGVTISAAARRRLDDLRGRRALSPADYASTSGIILRLEDDVWVNAPISDFNRNFVVAPRSTLDVTRDGFVVRGDGLESEASVWLPPVYHDQLLSTGRPANHFAFTHADRVRLSPIRGCAMRCRFCNVPYEDPYETKPVDSMIEAIDLAFRDPLQPAQHILISGGTPVPHDVAFLREVYVRVLQAFPGRHVDIMMVPVDGLFDLPRLKAMGLHELSINLELFSPEAASEHAPQKHRQGVRRYLEFIADATVVLGAGRVRSILMVGLEPAESTLTGVQAILEAGGVPVLSPFRPNPATPLRDLPPPTAETFEDIFLRATDLTAAAGTALGPSCAPCTHNTLTLAPAGDRTEAYRYPLPVMV